jgi:hypothetical protein
MSSLWTPGGERPVGRQSQEAAPGVAEPASQGPPPSTAPPAASPAAPPGGGREPTEEEMRAQLDDLRQQLAEAPPEVVIANHAFGLFELAAVHLSMQPPQLEQARLAIDAFGALVEGLAGRLGDAEVQLQEGLSQLRMAFVQIRGGSEGGTEA